MPIKKVKLLINGNKEVFSENSTCKVFYFAQKNKNCVYWDTSEFIRVSMSISSRSGLIEKAFTGVITVTDYIKLFL